MKFTYSSKLFTVYCSFDPAIDQANSDINEYMKTREEHHLKFLPGKQPVKFILKNIPKLLQMNIVSQQDSFTQTLMSFGYAIERIDNLQEWCLTEEVELGQAMLTSWEPVERTKIDNIEVKYMLPVDVIKTFANPVITEIATVALKKTLLLRGMRPDYPILPTSIELIGKLT